MDNSGKSRAKTPIFTPKAEESTPTVQIIRQAHTQESEKGKNGSTHPKLPIPKKPFTLKSTPNPPQNHPKLVKTIPNCPKNTKNKQNSAQNLAKS